MPFVKGAESGIIKRTIKKMIEKREARKREIKTFEDLFGRDVSEEQKQAIARYIANAESEEVNAIDNTLELKRAGFEAGEIPKVQQLAFVWVPALAHGARMGYSALHGFVVGHDLRQIAQPYVEEARKRSGFKKGDKGRNRRNRI